MTSHSRQSPLNSLADVKSGRHASQRVGRVSDEFARGQIERPDQRISVLGEMTAGLAHDFRNILAIVQSGASVARKAAPGSAKADLAWAAIHEAIARGTRLTNELLVFARGGTPDVKAHSVNELLTGASTILKYGAGPVIRVKLDLASAVPECLIDPVQFNAAILNLIVNSRDSMANGGEIRIATDECREPCGVSASVAEKWVRVRVWDQGSGMSPEIVEHLFDPFFTTKGDAGTGLGIPQVLAFMRASGGTVCVSTEPGAGTCFDLRFPAGQQVAPASTAQWRQAGCPPSEELCMPQEISSMPEATVAIRSPRVLS